MRERPSTLETKRVRLSDRLRRFWSLRRRYTYSHDWLLSIYHRLLMRFPRLPLPARHKTVRVWLKGTAEPFYVRMGTSDWYVLEEIFFDEVYAPLIKRGHDEVRQIIDLGANAGFSTRFWQLNFPQATIVAVEPDAANVRLWHRNILHGSSDDRTRMVQTCVLGTPRLVALDRSQASWRFATREASAPQEELIEGRTLVQIMAECSMAGDVDIIKCNIEGAEAEVFADCEEWIDRVRLLAIQVHHPYTAGRFQEDLRRAGAQLNLYHTMNCEAGSELLFLERS